MKKLLLISPTGKTFPLNFAFIISYLKRINVPYDFIDLNFFSLEKDRLDWDDYFAVGTGGLYHLYNELICIAKFVKKKAPNLPVILGGRICGIPRNILASIPVDFFVAQDADPALGDLVSALNKQEDDWGKINGIFYFKDGKLIANPPALKLPLDQFTPYWGDINMKEYFKSPMVFFNDEYPLVVGMGCVNRCTYCNPAISGFRLRPVDSVIAELIEVKEKYHFDFISVLTEIFYNTVELAEEFAEKYLAAKIDKPFFCSLRADTNPKIIKILERAGCKIVGIGLESYHQQALDAMHKNITIKQIDEITEEMKKTSMLLSMGFILGNPGDNRESVDATFDFFTANKFQFNIMQTYGVINYPGTGNYRTALEKGLIKDEIDYLSRLSSHDFSVLLKNLVGPGKYYPNVTTITNEELRLLISYSSMRQQIYNIRHFSSARKGPDSPYLVCWNCKSDIAVPAFIKSARDGANPFLTSSICRHCFTFNHFSFFVWSIKQLPKFPELLQRLKKAQKVAMVAPYQMIIALLTISEDNDIDFGKFTIVTSDNCSDIFAYSYPQISTATLGEIDNSFDLVISAALHCPAKVRELLLHQGLDKEKYFSATSIQFAQEHKKHLDNQNTYFEQTCPEDMEAFGELIGEKLISRFGANYQYVLPVNGGYAENVNAGIARVTPIADDFTDPENQRIFVSAQRIPEEEQWCKHLAEKYSITQSGIIISLYKDIMSELFDQLLLD